jgi:hypothetical protein
LCVPGRLPLDFLTLIRCTHTPSTHRLTAQCPLSPPTNSVPHACSHSSFSAHRHSHSEPTGIPLMFQLIFIERNIENRIINNLHRKARQSLPGVPSRHGPKRLCDTAVPCHLATYVAPNNKALVPGVAVGHKKHPTSLTTPACHPSVHHLAGVNKQRGKLPATRLHIQAIDNAESSIMRTKWQQESLLCCLCASAAPASQPLHWLHGQLAMHTRPWPATCHQPRAAADAWPTNSCSSGAAMFHFFFQPSSRTPTWPFSSAV